MTVTPFTVKVSDAEIADLRERLRRTRLAPEFANDDWRFGANGDYLRELLRYWESGYDWRQHERAINSVPNFKTSVDGVPSFSPNVLSCATKSSCRSMASPSCGCSLLSNE